MQDEKRTDPGHGGDRPTATPPAPDPESVGMGSGAGARPADTGRPLRRLLEESDRLDWQDVADLGIQIARELDSAHRQGHQRHRLITPENVLRTRNGLGYTLSLPGAADTLATTAAAAEYEAPEVWRAPDQVDTRADQFSLGVVLYEALAGNGKHPFRVDFRRVSKDDAGTQPSIEVSHSPQNDLRLLAPTAPERLVRVIEKATRLSPANRYESCGHLAEALHAVLSPTDEVTPTTPRARGSLWLGAGVGAIALVLFALIAYFVQPLIVGSRAKQQMEDARLEASQMAAAQFAASQWRQAEGYQPPAEYANRTRLYLAARDTAWRVRIGGVGEASKHAVDFEATDEVAFTQAIAARNHAEQQWNAHELEAAARSLAEAEDGFRAAVAARRMRWAAQIRKQLAAEVAKVAQTASGMDLGALRAQQATVEKAITDSEASPDDFRRAENAVADIRHEVASAMADAGAVEVARRSAEEAIGAADQARRAAEAWANKFERAKAPYDRGTAFLLSARDALDKDPSRALALADAATGRFRTVQTTAQAEVSAQRQSALTSQKRADRHRAKQNAETAYAAAERAVTRAEQASGNSVDGAAEQRDAYTLAKQKFDEAAENAAHAERAEAATSQAEPVVRAAVERTEPTARPAPPVAPPPPAAPVVAPAARPPAAVAALPPAKPLEPMSPTLARQIQRWMSQHCETVNRDLRGASDARARCENLTVHDRRDVGQVRVSYTFILGSSSSNGISWKAPTVRDMLLDCRSANCRCIAGPDCT